MRSDIPVCEECGRPLDRIDHRAIEHTILDNAETLYRPVGIMDGAADGSEFGMASNIQLACGYCGADIPIEARRFFYERWSAVKEYMVASGLTYGDEQL